MAIFSGTEGDDTFYDKEGNDTYYTGGGDDTFYFTNIKDYYVLDNQVYVYSDYGFDTIYHEGTGEVTINSMGDDGEGDYHDIMTPIEKIAPPLPDDVNYHDSITPPPVEAAPPTIEILEQNKPVKSSLHYVLNENSENLILTGNELENQITGNTDNNLLFGDKGDDNLIGLQGNDIILGAVGNDTLAGGSGNDTLTGHTGADTFVFSSPYDGSDSITDFNREEGDKIQISSTGFDIDLDDYSKFIFDTNSNQLLFELTPSDLLPIANLQPEANFNPISGINIVE